MIRKWFFALNEASLQDVYFWQSMIEVAVRSAFKNTKLIPHFIYDGRENDFVRHLRSLGVKVVPHRVSFHDALEKHAAKTPQYPLSTAGGAFLRTELPAIEQEDDVVLYTDCDVMFERDPVPGLTKPRFFSCAGEFSADDAINTGVMVMNLEALRQDLPAFVAYIRDNLDAFHAYDQGAYRSFYGDRFDRLSELYNWKPYWGVNDRARIVHFHGPKPREIAGFLKDPNNKTIPVYHDLFHKNREGYEVYFARWTTILNRVPAWRVDLQRRVGIVNKVFAKVRRIGRA